MSMDCKVPAVITSQVFVCDIDCGCAAFERARKRRPAAAASRGPARATERNFGKHLLPTRSARESISDWCIDDRIGPA